MRKVIGEFDWASRAARGDTCETGKKPFAKHKPGATAAILLSAALVVGSGTVRGAESSIHYLGHAGAHNLYVLNEDGNLFRWGEPRYGQFAGSPAPAVVPYYESVLTIPRSPAGVGWKQASGDGPSEIFVDEAGHAYRNIASMTQAAALIEIGHPDPGRGWRLVAQTWNRAELIDDLGEMYELRNVTSPDSELTKVGTPTRYGTSGGILEVVSEQGFDLVRTADGEIYGRGNSQAGLVGSEPVDGDSWSRVVRPAGVASWQWVRASASGALARGDDGHIYYWGRRVVGSEIADPNVDGRIPVAIQPPLGVNQWRSADISEGLVFLVSQAGELFVFGQGPTFLSSPSAPPNYGTFPVATLVDDPTLRGRGPFDAVQCGADYVLIQKSDGKTLHWGRFMQLYGFWDPGMLLPVEMILPESVTGVDQRLSPAVRILKPDYRSQLQIGEPLELTAEVFPLQGTLTAVEFLMNGFPIPGSVQLIGQQATIAWQAEYPGHQELKVRVTDSSGRIATSPVLSFETRHSVEWTISTNRISEPPGNDGLATVALVNITRTELPYPNYHAFSYRFQVTPRNLLGEDFTITGAEPANDGTGDWEVSFARGQKLATIQINALEDQFTDPAQWFTVIPSYTWADTQDYLPPEAPLSLQVEDAPSTFASSPVVIMSNAGTVFSFAWDTVPLTVSVQKTLTEHPVLELFSAQYLNYQQTAVEELPDRWLFHGNLTSLGEGLISIYARVWDARWGYGFNRYRDSAPVALRSWSREGLPNVRVLPGEQAVSEAAASSVTVSVVRDGDLAGPLDVALDIRGTGLNGSDYDAVPVTVTIPAGLGYVQLSLRVRNDALPELDELVAISAKRNACEQLEGCFVTDPGSVMRVTIIDDDRPAPVPTVDARVVASPFTDVSYLIAASGQLYAWGENLNGGLGLGALPAELAGQVPWPRRVGAPPGGGKWRSLFPGTNQMFATTDQQKLYAWGAGLAATSGTLELSEPYPVLSGTSGADPQFVENGALVGRLPNGRLQYNVLTTYLTHQLQPSGAPGMPALLVTPQHLVLSEDGYFHRPTDWGGYYPDAYPLAVDAGYWRDAAYSGDLIVAVDELGRLFQVTGGGYGYDAASGRTQRSFTTQTMPALASGRVVAKLFGNDRAVVALATDGTAVTLFSQAAGMAASGGEMVAFPDGVTHWVSFTAGRNHFLAVGDDGHVYAWGDNSHGQLGDGTNEAAEIPRRVPAFAAVNDASVTFPVSAVALPPWVRFTGIPASIALDGPSVVSVTAQAYDRDGFIDRVEFLVGGEVAALAEFDSQRQLFVADVFVPHPGDFTLTARAWDDSGLSSDSEGIPVHVEDPGLYPIVKVWNIPSGTAEGYGFPGYFVISRQGIADVPLTVFFDIEGTATEGVDYPALPRSVVIPAGAAEVRMPVIARPDYVDEVTEEVNLTILNPGCDPVTAEPGSGCYRIGAPETAPIFILDYLKPGDAYLPFVSMTLLDSPIAREGTTNVARIEVRRYGSFVEELPVAYTLGGTAENGVDYLPLSGNAVIPAGSDRVTITLSAIEDFVAEPFERVIVTMANPGCNVGPGSAEGCYLSEENNSLVLYIGDKPVLPPLPSGPLPNMVPRPALFDGLEYYEGQGTIVSVVSDPGAVFILQTSPDLTNWQALGKLTSVSGRMEFLDIQAASQETRYYRIVPPPDP